MFWRAPHETATPNSIKKKAEELRDHVHFTGVSMEVSNYS